MNKRNYKKTIRLNCVLLLLTVAMFISSCHKLVEAPVPSEYIADVNVYSVDATAIAVLDGIYISMNGFNQPFQGPQGIALITGLSSDELSLYGAAASGTGMYNSYYTNNLAQVAGVTLTGGEYWGPLYNYLFRVNAAIEGLTLSESLSPHVKKQLLGEAKFLRAFYYFYLTNLFGDVPLSLVTDPEVNSKLVRSPQLKVYSQIIEDLKDAEDKLSETFLDGQLFITTTERVRPTKWAAKALLARTFLFNDEWINAESKASEVIANVGLFSILPLNNVFLKNSREAIWQLQPTTTNFNTQEAQTLIIPATGPNPANPAFFSEGFLSQFEIGDQRAIYGNWIDTTIYKLTTTTYDTVAYPFKYKLNLLDAAITSTTNMKEYFMVLRLAEQYLIRAEAKTKLGKIAEAKDDLNKIRERAVLGQTLANDETSLLTAILRERQVELFCEWGHRWFDLKRTGKIDEVMNIATPLKSNGTVQWQPYKALYPLPHRDVFLNNVPNPYLTQNQGY